MYYGKHKTQDTRHKTQDTRHKTQAFSLLFFLFFYCTVNGQTDGQVLTLVQGGASWADASGDGIYSGNGTTPTDLEVTVLDSLEFDDGTLFIDAVDHRIGINEDDPTSTLHTNGSVAYAVDNFTATSTNSYDMGDDNYLLLANTANSDAVINLPAASTCEGRVYQFIKTDVNNSLDFNNTTIRTSPTATQTIWSGPSRQLKVISTGTEWYLLF